MKSALVICRGGYLGNPDQRIKGEEALPLPVDYSYKSPADALQGIDKDDTVLLPCFLNGRLYDAPEGEHREINHKR
jgi:hypothetical protein